MKCRVVETSKNDRESIEIFSTQSMSAQTRDFHLLMREVIIYPITSAHTRRGEGEGRTVGDLVASFNVRFGVNDNLLLAHDGDDTSVAIRRTAMIDESSIRTQNRQHSLGLEKIVSEPKISFLRRINNEILVHSEQIAGSDSLSLVSLLPSISDLLSDQFSNVFDDHFSDRNMSTSSSAQAHQKEKKYSLESE